MTPTRRHRANAIRALSMDAVQKANSGHPGMPMGMADIAEVLWNDFLKHDPADPSWVDRDRFVLSNGHGSMLLYALLHLSGYDLSIDDLKRFRQLHSRTPGHPEYGVTPGVETTTGPLGQGLGNAVGMAIAERTLAAEFNRDDCAIVDHYTYVFAGDGCLMEGVSHEACSLAGTLGLGKLIVVYDDNGISIDGEVDRWFTDDTPGRFRAYGWHVVPDVDGHDAAAVGRALQQARRETEKPSLLCCRTLIGFGAPGKEGTASCHGAPLGEEEVAAAKQRLGWEPGPFEVPGEIYAAWSATERGAEAQRRWSERLDRYRERYPGAAREFDRRMRGDLPEDWPRWAADKVKELGAAPRAVATRKSSQMALNAYAPGLPGLVGGSADLADSNLTRWAGSKPMSRADFSGRYIHFGVREFGMAAITNGLALHGGLIPFCATFLVFSDYARNALRMAALMRVSSIFVFTHDSIGLGEDGPTHQAVEQAASLRLVPNMSVWRPCDTVESAIAWQAALERRGGPTCLLFSRQSVPQADRDASQVEGIGRGGYVLRDCRGEADAIVIAAGSEVALALDAAEELITRRIRVRVVSMPSTDTFDRQPEAYREAVLPGDVVARVAVEAGVTDGWRKYVGPGGRVVGLDTFGESAPAPDLYEHFAITVAGIVDAVLDVVGQSDGVAVAAAR